MTQPLSGWMQEAVSSGGNLQGQIQALAGANGVDLSNPLIAQNLQSVLSTAKAEGIDALNLGQEQLSRVKTLFESFNQVYNSHTMSGAADAVASSIGAARKFVTNNHELSGALDATQGLVKAFAAAEKNGSANPVDLMAAMAGPVMAAMVAAGAATAGVGAAVVAIIAVADELLNIAGVFGPPKPGFDLGMWKYTGSLSPPTFVINQTVVYDDHNVSKISISDKLDWRRFPEYNNKDDAFWFNQYTPKTNFTQWRGAAWIVNPNWGNTGDDNMFYKMYRQMGEKLYGIPEAFVFTPMSSLFPEWWAVNARPVPVGAATFQFQGQNLSREQTAALVNFSAAFVQAWKANKEWWLNGWQGGTDDAVLAHLILLWNRAHAPGQGLDVHPEYPDANSGMFMSASKTYWVTLINTLRTSGQSQALSADGQSVHINTGPALPVPKVDAGGAQARPVIHLGGVGAVRQINLPHQNPITIKLPLGAFAQKAGPQPMPTRIHLLAAAIERRVQRYDRYIPAAAGLAAIPFVGPIGLIGVAASGAWLLKDKLQKK